MTFEQIIDYYVSAKDADAITAVRDVCADSARRYRDADRRIYAIHIGPATDYLLRYASEEEKKADYATAALTALDAPPALV